jgi:SOS response regulatory protein OraA/RecX
MIEINSKEQVLRMGDLSSPISQKDNFIITVRYLRAQSTGEAITIGVELTDTLRNLTEVRRYTVQTELLGALNIHRGVISREKLDAVEAAAQVSAAYTRALTILAYGANSAQALILKLRQRGFDAAVSQEAVSLLCERGYLREESDAGREAERCLAKGWGRRRIESYLRQRGYTKEAADLAMKELEDTDEGERCAKAARRKSCTAPDDEKEKQKLIAYLIRQGYDMTTIRHALSFAWDEQ